MQEVELRYIGNAEGILVQLLVNETIYLSFSQVNA